MRGVVLLTLVAAGFALLGSWGLRNAPDLVPANLSEERRTKDVRALRRGARSCQVAAGFFAILGVLALVDLVWDA